MITSLTASISDPYLCVLRNNYDDVRSITISIIGGGGGGGGSFKIRFLKMYIHAYLLLESIVLRSTSTSLPNAVPVYTCNRLVWRVLAGYSSPSLFSDNLNRKRTHRNVCMGGQTLIKTFNQTWRVLKPLQSP